MIETLINLGKVYYQMKNIGLGFRSILGRRLSMHAIANQQENTWWICYCIMSLYFKTEHIVQNSSDMSQHWHGSWVLIDGSRRRGAETPDSQKRQHPADISPEQQLGPTESEKRYVSTNGKRLVFLLGNFTMGDSHPRLWWKFLRR